MFKFVSSTKKKQNEADIEKLKLERPLYKSIENEKIGIPDAYDPTKIFRAGEPKGLLPNYVGDQELQQATETKRYTEVWIKIAVKAPENIKKEEKKSTFTTFAK